MKLIKVIFGHFEGEKGHFEANQGIFGHFEGEKGHFEANQGIFGHFEGKTGHFEANQGHFEVILVENIDETYCIDNEALYDLLPVSYYIILIL